MLVHFHNAAGSFVARRIAADGVAEVNLLRQQGDSLNGCDHLCGSASVVLEMLDCPCG
jgi:hypothetical protein